MMKHSPFFGKSRTTLKGFLKDSSNSARILNITADTMFLLTREGICMDMEIRTDRWFLQDPSQYIGKDIFQLIPYETSIALKNNFNKVLETGVQSADNYEVQVGGKTYFFKCILNRLDDYILCQYRDITQRILLKQRLEIMNRKLKDIEKVALISQWTFNLRTKELLLSGFSGENTLPTDTRIVQLEDFIALVRPTDRETVRAFIRTNTEKFTRSFVDYQLILKGLPIYFRARNICIYEDESGDTIMEGYVQNISDIRQKQHELEMITRAVQNSTDYVFAINQEGSFLFGNRRFRDIHGWSTEDDITGFNLFETIAKGAMGFRWKDIIHQLSSSRNTLNFVLSKPIPEKPEILAFDCTSYLVNDSYGGNQIWTFGKDITERVNYEKQVKELNQIMSTILTNIPMNISVKDADNDFRYIFCNSIGETVNWGDENDIIGKTDFDLYPREEAIRLRSEDIHTLNTKEEIRKTLSSKDEDGNPIIIDQLRILVEDEIRPLLICIERDVTKDKLMEQELIDAKEKAEQSDKLKSAFIANMSHEIRTPLNAIVGFSRIISETQDPEERKTYYSIVETNNSRLLGLINEILDLSKIESGIMEFDNENVQIHDLLEEIVLTLSQRCPPGVQLVFDEANPDMHVFCDKNRMSQVFNNLIGNAMKFTVDGYIRVGYQMRGEDLELYVSDTGSGIAPDKIDLVFDRFIKGDNFTQGTGLGLPICKSIIEKMRGRIEVQSTVGVGTLFTIILPRELILQPDKKDGDGSGENGKKIILVAEDTDSNYALLEALIGEQYTLKRAMNGMDAVNLYQELKPDLILMDIKMPLMNGLEATKVIRSISPDVPIVAQSAYAFDQDRNTAMEVGCNDFLSKPFTKPQVIDIIARNLSVRNPF